MPTGIYIRTEEHRKKLSQSNTKYWLGKKRPDISEKQQGENNPMWGKKHSEETKSKISKNNIRYWLGKKRPDFSEWQRGRKFSKEHLENLKISHLGQKGFWKDKKRMNMMGENHPSWKLGKKTMVVRILLRNGCLLKLNMALCVFVAKKLNRKFSLLKTI